MEAGAAAALAYAALGLASFALFGWDKRQARRGARRVPERTLHLVTLLGGFAGAWLGMRAFRHKTQHALFRVLPFLAAALHALGWYAALRG